MKNYVIYGYINIEAEDDDAAQQVLDRLNLNNKVGVNPWYDAFLGTAEIERD